MRSGSTYEDDDRRAAISARIEAVRAEITDEETRQEATIERTEMIHIEQDLDTGRLIGDAAAD